LPPEPLGVPGGEGSAQLESGEAFADCVEVQRGFVDRVSGERLPLVKASDPGLEDVKGSARRDANRGGGPQRAGVALEDDSKQGGMLDG